MTRKELQTLKIGDIVSPMSDASRKIIVTDIVGDIFGKVDVRIVGSYLDVPEKFQKTPGWFTMSYRQVRKGH